MRRMTSQTAEGDNRRRDGGTAVKAFACHAASLCSSPAAQIRLPADAPHTLQLGLGPPARELSSALNIQCV